MTYYARQNLVLEDGEEYAIGEEIKLEDYSYLQELIARELVTDRPAHRNVTNRSNRG